MKRIVIDCRTWRFGTGRYQERMVHYLQRTENERTKYEHEYLILLRERDFDSFQPTNPNFKKVLCPYKEFTFGEQIGLLRQLNSLKPDLVHFPMVQQPILYRGNSVTTFQDLTTVRFRNPTKNAVIFTIKQQAYKFVNWYVAHKTKFLITPTEFVKKDVAKWAGVPENKFTVTLESADPLPRPAKPLPRLKNKKFIMYLGRPTPHKNLGRLIDAFVLLQKSHPDLTLVLAGKIDDMYRVFVDRVKREDIKNVMFTDFVTDQELRWLYENCQAYVFPSLSEGFGLPALEAMLHGAPLVSTNATCSPEVYGNGAHYFDPHNTDDMVAKISDVLDNPRFRKQLIARGKKQASKYSWERMARQTLEVYQRALGEK